MSWKAPPPPPLKQSTRNLSLGYTLTEIEKRSRALGHYRSFLCDLYLGCLKLWFVLEQKIKVCDSCIVSSWALLIFLLCLWWQNSSFLCCVVTQNGESSRDLLLFVTNKKALAQPRRAPPPSRHPFKTLITLLPVTFSQLDRSWVLVGGKGFYFDRLSFNRWLKLLTVKYLVSWHLE